MHAFYFIKYVYLTIYQSNQTSQLALFMHYLFLEKYIITFLVSSVGFTTLTKHDNTIYRKGNRVPWFHYVVL